MAMLYIVPVFQREMTDLKFLFCFGISQASGSLDKGNHNLTLCLVPTLFENVPLGMDVVGLLLLAFCQGQRLE